MPLFLLSTRRARWPRAAAVVLAASCWHLLVEPAGALHAARKGDLSARLEPSHLRGSALSSGAIEGASAYATRPAGAQDSPAAAPAPEHKVVVFHPSGESVEPSGKDPEDHAWYSWGTALPAFRKKLGSMHNDTSSLRDLFLQPLDMQLGARVMNEISRKPSGTHPPSQEKVNEEYTAQCPMVMFGNGLYIGAPQCKGDLSRSMGTWQDPSQSRTVLRWQGNSAGGARFSVDSKVSGDGSVLFADISEVMTLNTYVFSLTNCLGAASFVVEESIIKIDKFGKGATTARDHDLSVSTQAFFYKYAIKNPSTGEIVAETSLYRADTHQVNITIVQEGSLEGSVVASATRVGSWSSSAYTACTESPKGWNISFPTAASAFDTVATVQDLRVASAVVVTLMSLRDQAVASDGLVHTGSVNMFWNLIKSFFALVFGSILIYIAWEVIHSRGLDKKISRILFRLETALLPQRPATKEWNLPIHATW